jgi:tRNA A-37 threonylcarbamoyl transferase component Bud32
MGASGTYISFSSSNMINGFERWVSNNGISLYRIKPKSLPNTLPNSMGIKFQMFFSEDKYFEASTIKEENILERLSNSNMKDFVPIFYFGCTITVPITIADVKLTIRTRMTFTEHLDEYSNLLLVLRSPTYIPRNEHLESIKKVLYKLWKNGISHNDFAAQNIMIIPMTGQIKLIDFGLATLHKYAYPHIQTDDLQTLYQDYYSRIPQDTLLENEGTNVKKLGELITEYKSRMS